LAQSTGRNNCCNSPTADATEFGMEERIFVNMTDRADRLGADQGQCVIFN
jgi:hypothetical protein